MNNRDTANDLHECARTLLVVDGEQASVSFRVTLLRIELLFGAELSSLSRESILNRIRQYEEKAELLRAQRKGLVLRIESFLNSAYNR